MKTALNKVQIAILQTILYSDIFNFPLTADEVWKNLISKDPLKKTEVVDVLSTMGLLITCKKGFYCLRGRSKIIDERISRMKNIAKKMKIGVKVARVLSFIPTIYFIGVSGRLSHMDADLDDDIDLILITRKKTLWVTRLILLFTLEILNVRRNKHDKTAKNKICPNLIIDETAMQWPQSRRDVYTAHEMISIYPLYNKNNTYERFLTSNKWIKGFYPNFFTNQPFYFPVENPKKYITISLLSYIITQPFFEFVFHKIQGLYMRNSITSEVIKENFAAFHPMDFRPKVIKSFAEKLSKIA